jgi:hypothetical protein
MNKTWKWIVGTLLFLVVIAAIVFALAAHTGFMRNGLVERGFFQPRAWNGFDHHSYMMGNNFRPGSMMRGFGFLPPALGFGFALLRGLIPLALLGLIVYGAYKFGKKKSSNQGTEAIEPVADPSAAEQVVEKNCRKCGSVVHEDWRNCPYCGTKQ